MTKYEQLQEFLNKCIELWWKPRWYENIIINNNKKNELWLFMNTKLWHRVKNYSIHDIFSKESGLMEFVGWEIEPDHEEIYISESGRYVENNEYHYMIMWPMTAEMKVEYFLQNALLPTNTDDTTK